jgi:hypothetical protein
MSVQRLSSRLQQLDSVGEKTLMLNGRMACWSLLRNRRIKNLAEAEFTVFSQWGEDGIIEWLVSHVPVPVNHFIEFGAGNFREANCRFLMLNRNWRGLVMDASEGNVESLRREAVHWRHDVTAHCSFVTSENVNAVLADNGFQGSIGVLSIDVDGNDYWIWESIEVIDPAIVVCEYNAVFGDQRSVSVPYVAGFVRQAAHRSGLYFGCSIGALKHLGAERGYEFVGTNSNGVNAFFVRRDLAGEVLKSIDEVLAFPSRLREGRDGSGRLSFAARMERFRVISHLPVVDVTTGEEIILGEMGTPYSKDWLAGML